MFAKEPVAAHQPSDPDLLPSRKGRDDLFVRVTEHITAGLLVTGFVEKGCFAAGFTDVMDDGTEQEGLLNHGWQPRHPGVFNGILGATVDPVEDGGGHPEAVVKQVAIMKGNVGGAKGFEGFQ